MIKIYDDLFDDESISRFLTDIKSQDYHVDVSDNGHDTESGCSSPVSYHSLFYNKMLITIQTSIPEVANLTLTDCYINCFFPREFPNFHVDSDDASAMTLLYYANSNEFNEGGTEIYNSDTHEVRCILPKPGRIVIFSGNYLHRATSFRDKKRFTVAFKYK